MTKTMRGCNTDETGLALANVAKKPLFPGNKKKKNCSDPSAGIVIIVSTLERVETWFPLWKGDW